MVGPQCGCLETADPLSRARLAGGVETVIRDQPEAFGVAVLCALTGRGILAVLLEPANKPVDRVRGRAAVVLSRAEGLERGIQAGRGCNDLAEVAP
jgi:hypothetical protein